MFAMSITGILVAMALVLYRAVKGPTIFDTILAVNSFGTFTVLFIAVLGFLEGRPEFLDLGLVYALMNFAGTIAILKYLKYGALGVGEEETG